MSNNNVVRMLALSAIVAIAMPLAYGSSEVGLTPAETISVDGSLADWGVDADPHNNGWASTQGVWAESDGHLAPGAGGHNFDIEAMYGGVDHTGAEAVTMYMAIATGFDIEGQTVFGVGDLFIDFANDGSWDLAFDLSGSSVTGNVNVYGNFAPGDITDPPLFGSSTPWEINLAAMDASNLLGQGAFAYVNDAYATDHNVYEFGLDMNTVGSSWLSDVLSGDGFTAHWTMECGNDVMELEVPSVPVPPSMAIGMLGMGLVGFMRRRRPQL